MNFAKSLSSYTSNNDFLCNKLEEMCTSYIDICNLAAINSSVFNNFKRNKYYVQILEHVSPEIGLKYLKEIMLANKIDLINKKEMITCNDLYGNPFIVDYDILKISPSSLRYAKVCSDILRFFNFEMESIDIVEIGIGYGGQCLILNNFFNIKNYYLIDITPALSLAKTYLEKFVLTSKLHFLTLNEINSLASNIVISNYAYSELNKELQDVYFDKIIINSKNGYFLYNNINPSNYNSYSNSMFASRLTNSYILSEYPLTHPENKLIVNGSNLNINEVLRERERERKFRQIKINVWYVFCKRVSASLLIRLLSLQIITKFSPFILRFHSYYARTSILRP